MDSAQKSNTDKDVDLYRDTPVRYLGYANEVGESFRALIHVNLVRFTYIVASAYVSADALSKGGRAYKASNEEQKLEKIEKKDVTSGVSKVVLDTFVWQAFASVIIPGFTINRLCYVNNKLLEKLTKLPCGRRQWLVTAIGLTSIPLIIRPIDRFVDWSMDNTFRKIIK